MRKVPHRQSGRGGLRGLESRVQPDAKKEKDPLPFSQQWLRELSPSPGELSSREVACLVRQN